ncbi:MAG: PKD domain containing protein [Micromonosporaceae bacterium]
MRRILTVALVLAAVTAALLPAQAAERQSRVVSDNPVDWTPHVRNGIVYAIAAAGDTVVVGGDFSQVTEADGSGTLVQSYLFAFDRGTGKLVRSFRPRLNGPVRALAAGANGTVYAGGHFDQVDGESQPALVRLRLSDGTRYAAIDGPEGGDVRTLSRAGNYLYAGGTFSRIAGRAQPALARLNLRTGEWDSGFDLKLAGAGSARLRIEHLATSLDGRRLVFDGTFGEVAGQRRFHIALVDIGASPARLTGWSTEVFREPCSRWFDTYLRDVDFAPDGSYLVVATTGRLTGEEKLCDAALRFETSGRGDQQPTWVNKTGGNTLFAVAVTGAAVYVGGHQRWLDNPDGDREAGPGAVSRVGIGAIDPESGKALSWNPTRTRGVGVQCLLVTPGGLWVGSDTDELGHEYHGRIGVFPTT